jgi:hypothetical protein
MLHPHYSHEDCELLSENYHGSWIDGVCEAPVSWPAHSPDFNPLLFFMWEYLKTKVYASTIYNREELWHQI